MANKAMFKVSMAFIDGKNYLVEDFPEAKVERLGPDALKKGVAYRYETDITKGLFPFRGVIDDDFSFNTAKVGIWFRRIRHDHHKLVIVRPRSREELEEYSLANEQNIPAAVMNHEFTTDQFTDNSLNASDIGSDLYLPPIHPDDDFLNILMKVAIRAKDAPFDPYGRRMEALAVDRKKSTEGTNIKNNTRRRHRLNRTMTPSKFMQDAETWQLVPVVLLKDAPGAMHRMNIPENTLLAMYPGGVPIDLSKYNIMDISPMVAEALADTVNIDETYLNYDKDDDDGDAG